MLHLNHKSESSRLAWWDLVQLVRAETAENAAIKYGVILGTGQHIGRESAGQVLRLYQEKREELTACQKIGF
jgi:hypothetical protein